MTTDAERRGPHCFATLSAKREKGGPPDSNLTSAELDDFLGELVQALEGAGLIDQVVVANPILRFLGQPGGVQGEVDVLLDGKGLVEADQRPLHHVVALAMAVEALLRGSG